MWSPGVARGLRLVWVLLATVVTVVLLPPSSWAQETTPPEPSPSSSSLTQPPDPSPTTSETTPETVTVTVTATGTPEASSSSSSPASWTPGPDQPWCTDGSWWCSLTVGETAGALVLTGGLVVFLLSMHVVGSWGGSRG
jgi:hypothetical protein